jgi:hypothetical protein
MDKICFYWVNQIPEKRADVKIKCERNKCTIFKEISEERKRLGTVCVTAINKSGLLICKLLIL